MIEKSKPIQKDELTVDDIGELLYLSLANKVSPVVRHQAREILGLLRARLKQSKLDTSKSPE